MAPIDWVEAHIQARSAHLTRFHPAITRCHVVVEPVQRHHHLGDRLRVHLEVTAPGLDIVVAREATLYSGHTEPSYSSTALGNSERHQHATAPIRKAFEAARRQLQDARLQFIYAPIRRLHAA